jgi:hypothetical protein
MLAEETQRDAENLELFKLHVIDGHLACLNPPHDLSEVWVLYFQCILDQPAGLSRY